MAYFLAFLMLAVIAAAVWFVLRAKPIGNNTIATINELARKVDQRNAGRAGRPHEDDL